MRDVRARLCRARCGCLRRDARFEITKHTLHTTRVFHFIPARASAVTRQRRARSNASSSRSRRVRPRIFDARALDLLTILSSSEAWRRAARASRARRRRPRGRVCPARVSRRGIRTARVKSPRAPPNLETLIRTSRERAFRSLPPSRASIGQTTARASGSSPIAETSAPTSAYLATATFSRVKTLDTARERLLPLKSS